MKRRRGLSTFLLLTATWLPASLHPAAAADGADAAYRELVSQAIQGGGPIDFRQLRFACLKAGICDAHGDTKTLIAARQALQAKKYEAAIRDGELLVEHGFVNIEAHVICEQAYEGLNDQARASAHHAVASGLIGSIFRSGDGKSKETAFEVIGTFEEYIVLSVMGLPRPASQALQSGKPHSFDLLVTTNPATNEKITVYFNIDAFYPM